MGHNDRPGAQALQFSTARRLIFVPSTFYPQLRMLVRSDHHHQRIRW